MRMKLSRDEFSAITKGQKHDDETHDAEGAMLYWEVDGKTYVEWQPDIGPCEWFMTD